MSEELKQYILKNGLILGTIYVFFCIFKYLSGVDTFVDTYFGIASLLLSIIFPVYYCVQLRKIRGGYIDFKEVFTVCTGILIAAGFIDVVFQILLLNIIDPGFAVDLLDASINAVVAQLDTFGVPEDEIALAIENIESNSNYSPMNLLKGFCFSVLGYSIFGLIVAVIIKKNKPEFLNE